MKSAIVGSVAAILLIVAFIIIGTLQINTNIRDELHNSVNNAMTATQRVILDKRKEIKNNEEYLNEFNENMKKQLNDTDAVTYAVDVYGVDYKKGLLDVEVTAKYKNLYGQNREIHTRKTMIIDSIPKE